METAVLNGQVVEGAVDSLNGPLGEDGNYEAVDRIALAEGAQVRMVIRSVEGSELILGPWRLTAMGDCITPIHISMARGTNWEVDRMAGERGEARFLRDAEVVVGQPFSIVFSSPEDRRLRISLGEVTAIRICRI
jgi:hypothetical protein